DGLDAGKIGPLRAPARVPEAGNDETRRRGDRRGTLRRGRRVTAGRRRGQRADKRGEKPQRPWLRAAAYAACRGSRWHRIAIPWLPGPLSGLMTKSRAGCDVEAHSRNRTEG